MASAVLRSHAAASAALTRVLIESLVATRRASLTVGLVVPGLVIVSAATASVSGIVLVTAATAATSVTTLVSASLVAVLHVSTSALIVVVVVVLAVVTLVVLPVCLVLIVIVVAVGVALCTRDDAPARLLAQVVWDRVINLAKLAVSVRVLAILAPLAVALVFEMATLLSLEPLIQLTGLELLRHGLSLRHGSHLLLHKLLLRLVGHGHLLGLGLLLRGLRLVRFHLLDDGVGQGHLRD